MSLRSVISFVFFYFYSTFHINLVWVRDWKLFTKTDIWIWVHFFHYFMFLFSFVASEMIAMFRWRNNEYLLLHLKQCSNIYANFIYPLKSICISYSFQFSFRCVRAQLYVGCFLLLFHHPHWKVKSFNDRRIFRSRSR